MARPLASAPTFHFIPWHTTNIAAPGIAEQAACSASLGKSPAFLGLDALTETATVITAGVESPIPSEWS
jgi:hypothetical protein